MEKLFCCRIHWNPSRSVLNRRSKISFILEFVASNQKLRYCSPTGLSRSHWSEVLVLRCDWTKNVYSPVRGSRPWATPVLAWPDWIFQSKSIKIWWRDALRLWIDSVLKIRQQIFTLNIQNTACTVYYKNIRVSEVKLPIVSWDTIKFIWNYTKNKIGWHFRKLHKE